MPDLLAALVETLAGFATIDPKAIKAYHTLRPVWVMGQGGPSGFVHCTVSVLTGRDLTLRQQIAAEMVRVIRLAYVASVTECEAAVTLELREMDRETYQK